MQAALEHLRAAEAAEEQAKLDEAQKAAKQAAAAQHDKTSEHVRRAIVECRCSPPYVAALCSLCRSTARGIPVFVLRLPLAPVS